MSFAGYHDVLRWHIARLLRYPVERVAVSEAHYVAGNAQPIPWAGELAGLGIVRHDVPVTPQKGEIGADVELALTCYQVACEKRADAMVLMSGDGDLGPLAARIQELGVELVVPVTNYRFPNGTGTLSCRTSNLLLRYATSAPEFTDLIDAAQSPDYPPGLLRPLITDRHKAGQRREGHVTIWHHSMSYGYITAADGQTWYANADDVSDGTALRYGKAVTFMGSAVAPEGRSYPRARDIRVTTEDEQKQTESLITVRPSHRVADRLPARHRELSGE